MRGSIRAGSLLAAATLMAAVLVPSAPAGTRTQIEAPDCEPKSWIGGSVELCAGALIYRDYVYDDYGADTRDASAPTTGTLSRPAGDVRYPEGAEASADLVDLTLRIDDDELVATFELNALYKGDETTAALAIDTDDDLATGGGEWEDLGVSSEGWEVLATFSKGDPETNIIEGRISLPDGDRWRVQAVTAQAGGPVMNVAFRGVDEETADGAWWDDLQAEALADSGGGGDISAFGYEVKVADMLEGASSLPQLATGFHQRVYTSKYTLPPGEGMSYAGTWGRHGETTQVCEQQFHFYGKYQPFGIYIPEGPEPHGMQLAMHGCEANHSSLVDQPGMQQRFGEELNRIIVVPLGRGPIGYYSDISERDVLDVIKDVKKSYDVDRDRVFSGGYSMGGYGAFRMAMLFPHKFAGFVSWVGFTGDCFNGSPAEGEQSCRSGAVGNVIKYVANLRHVPGAMLYGGADELVHSSSSQAMADEFAAHDSPYVFFFHPAAEHFTFALADDWAKEASYTADLTRARNPGHITFKTRPSLGSPKFKIFHNRAYWVHGIKQRGKGAAFVDITSFGCERPDPQLTVGTSSGTDPVPWVSEFKEMDGTKESRTANHIEANLRNVRKLTLDVKGACIGRGRLRYDIKSTGKVKIRFSNGREPLVLGKGPNLGVWGRSEPAPRDRPRRTRRAE